MSRKSIIGPNQAITQFVATNKRPNRGTVTASWTPKTPGTYFVTAYQAQTMQRTNVKRLIVGNGMDVFGNCIVY